MIDPKLCLKSVPLISYVKTTITTGPLSSSSGVKIMCETEELPISLYACFEFIGEK